MIQKSKIRKSWYASTGMTKKEYYEYSVNVYNSRKEKRSFLKKRDRIIQENISPETQKLRSGLFKNHSQNANIICDLVNQNYRGVGSASHPGDRKINVGELGVEINSYLDWNIYSKRTRFSAKVFYYSIHLPLFYELPPENLRIIDGLMNIKIDYLETQDDMIIYKATWIEQERGINVAVVDGYIGYSHEHQIYYHSQFQEEIYKKLRLKINKIIKEKSKKNYDNYSLTDYITRKKFHELTGACYSGIENFCNKAGIDKKQRRVMIKDILPLLKKHAEFYYNLVVKNAPHLIEE